MVLEVDQPDIPRRRVELGPGSITVGRASDCELQLRDATVSQRHARIVVEADSATLVDLSSGNGALVNGRRVAARWVLRAGDRVLLGACRLEVLEAPEPEREP